jgi:diguanylate cyclase (GGDEF)-like protein/PAS domain S-box-containing protein
MSDADLLFTDDDMPPLSGPETANPWRVLVVDDDIEVHVATRLALSDVTYLGRPLELISVHSGHEARRLLPKLDDIAIILLDVVMETDDAGLRLVHHIRDEMGWHETRIVLRTGQPGVAPERDVILRYDINDYKAKSELTDSRLFTTVVTALRSYRHLRNLEESRSGLRKVIDAAASLHQGRSMELFANGVLLQLGAILETDSHSILCTHRHIGDSGDVTLLAGSGRFTDMASNVPNTTFGLDVNARLQEALISQCSSFGPDYVSIYLRTPNGREVIVYIESPRPFSELDLTLLEMFGHNISIGYDNLEMYRELLAANENLERRVSERTTELRRFKAAVDNTAASILITDPNGVIEYSNPAVSLSSLYPDSELLGQRSSLFKSGLVPVERFELLWDTILAGSDWRGELLNKRKNGELYWEDVSISPVTDEGGVITHFVAVKEDISGSKKREEELWRLATVDPLTGVLNRRSFSELATHEFSRCHQHARALAILMVDIDHFKSINDTYGHPTGDHVIRTVAMTCRAVLRDRDIIGRLGGEEFAFILPEAPSDQSEIVAERLRAAVAGTVMQFADGHSCSVTVSVGISNMAASDTDVGVLIGRADAALYRAKQSGRNCVCAAD